MHVGQQKYINLIKVWNLTNEEIFSYSGVSKPTIADFKKGLSVRYDKHKEIIIGIDQAIKHRKSLK